ncbi:MAG: hypothetical protein JEZ06_00410 [Anaerolineaceae bacterium]|nr:hypothetical protein [Anaerolineaceae bacterium]
MSNYDPSPKFNFGKYQDGEEPNQTTFSKSTNVIVNQVQRTSTYYSITEAEIDNYANLSLLATTFFSLFGLIGGFALGCIVPIILESLDEQTKTYMILLASICGSIAFIFLIIAFFLEILKWKNKKVWKINK